MPAFGGAAPAPLALRLAQLSDWYGALTPLGLGRMDEFYRADARFKDPFNEVTGIEAIERILRHMFDRTEQPRFVIRETLAGRDRAFLTWDFEFGLHGRRLRVHGATRLVFDAAGLIAEQRDFWDPAEELWQKLPVLGPMVAWLRRRMRAR